VVADVVEAADPGTHDEAGLGAAWVRVVKSLRRTSSTLIVELTASAALSSADPTRPIDCRTPIRVQAF
jgi:hypothetical protein